MIQTITIKTIIKFIIVTTVLVYISLTIYYYIYSYKLDILLKHKVDKLNKSQYDIYPKNIPGAILISRDTFLGIIPFVWHAAIVLDSERIVESTLFGVNYAANDWDISRRICYAIIPDSKYKISQDKLIYAAYWAQQQIGKMYNYLFFIWKKKNPNIIYCTQLVWAAYYNSFEIDIMSNHPTILLPMHLLTSPNTNIIFYKDPRYN
jgi:uncharacterized protein YycO